MPDEIDLNEEEEAALEASWVKRPVGYLAGWDARHRGLPFDEFQSEGWKKGWTDRNKLK